MSPLNRFDNEGKPTTHVGRIIWTAAYAECCWWRRRRRKLKSNCCRNNAAIYFSFFDIWNLISDNAIICSFDTSIECVYIILKNGNRLYRSSLLSSVFQLYVAVETSLAIFRIYLLLLLLFFVLHDTVIKNLFSIGLKQLKNQRVN